MYFNKILMFLKDIILAAPHVFFVKKIKVELNCVSFNMLMTSQVPCLHLSV